MCNTVCEGVTRDSPSSEAARQNWSACFSCRCKVALGQLPPKEKLKCSTAEGPLTRWRTQRKGSQVVGLEVIDPNGTNTERCLNAGMATSQCDLQSRFKRFVYAEGDLEYQMLCRKRTASSEGYHEYLLIGHNAANGATCFWQSSIHNFNGEDVPEIDLTGANDTPENRSAYANTFYTRSNGGLSNCATCHTTDAFLWSPYLESEWPLSQALNDPITRARIEPGSKYFRVVADSPQLERILDPSDDLTAEGQPLARDCGSCHRVSRASCYFARVAVGIGADNGGFTHTRALTHWMPPRRSLTEFQGIQTVLREACGF